MASLKILDRSGQSNRDVRVFEELHFFESVPEVEQTPGYFLSGVSDARYEPQSGYDNLTVFVGNQDAEVLDACETAFLTNALRSASVLMLIMSSLDRMMLRKSSASKAISVMVSESMERCSKRDIASP